MELESRTVWNPETKVGYVEVLYNGEWIDCWDYYLLLNM